MHQVPAKATAIRPDEGKRNFGRVEEKRKERVRCGPAESEVNGDEQIGGRENVHVECPAAGQGEQEAEETETQRETEREEQGGEDEEGEARAQKSG